MDIFSPLIQNLAAIISIPIAIIMGISKITDISISTNQKKLSLKKEFIKTKGLSSNSKKLIKENIETLCFQNETGIYEENLDYRIALLKLRTNSPEINWPILKEIKRFLVFQNNQIIIDASYYWNHVTLTSLLILFDILLAILLLFSNPISNLIVSLSFLIFYIMMTFFIAILLVPLVFIKKIRPKLKKQ